MKSLPATLAIAVLLPSTLAGQARFSAGVGVMAGTKLVKDRIFQSIEVSQKPMPLATLGVAFPVSARERAGFDLGLGFGKTTVQEAGFPDTDGPSFRLLTATFGISGPIIGPLRWYGGAGLLKYYADKEGFFRQGGPTLLILTGGADYPIAIRSKVSLLARIRYDYQRFSTDELRATGFGRTQDVHRIGAGLAIEYTR
jgi:hypothetical protein